MDVFNLTDTNITEWVFFTNGTTNSWQIWQKPKNCKFISILAIGGGGGGGGGTTGAQNTNRAGGGGGGGAGVCRVVYNSNILPDTLFIQVGPGGTGGASNGNGAAGSISYVSVEPNLTVTNTVVRSSNASPGGGTAIGGAGAAATIVTQANMRVSYLGLFQANAGNIGAIGTSAAAGSNITVSFITTGGAGGGGASSTLGFNGGNITGIGSIPTISGGVAGATNNGDSGFQTVRPSSNSHIGPPIFFTGGAGGGGFRTGIGGAGGNASYGCGGGGGGAGTTGGVGGRGGDGLVIITSW